MRERSTVQKIYVHLLALAIYSLSLPLTSVAAEVDLVLIEKSNRQLILKSGAKVIASYKVALGGSPIGAKQCQGDNKTPEGDYTISGRNPGSAYHRSLRVSYPNANDRKNAKRLGCSPGGDIMIHGLPNGQGWLGSSHRLHDWTLGCIAVTNEEIEAIWKAVPDGTKVRIVP